MQKQITVFEIRLKVFLLKDIPLSKMLTAEEINVIDISDCTEILSAMKDRIKNVEVYYNPYTTKLVSAIEEAKIYNIVTQKEV